MRIFIFICLLIVSEAHSSQERLTRYLTELVQLDSVTSNHEGNMKALKYVERQLEGLNLYFKYYEYNGFPSLVITTQDTQKPTVFLVSHIDVVAAPQALFSPRIEGNKMYGRGVYDMKMAIACYILLMQELKDKHLNIGIMLTSDEEIGGMNGTRRLLDAGYSSEVAFLPDGGFDWNFEEEAKGVLHIKVMAKGVAAHSSRPWNGENAINKLMAALQEINRYFDLEKSKYGDYYPTANVGIIQGGKGVNQVPDYAEAKVDIRFPSGITAGQIFINLKDLVKDQVALENLIEASPNMVDVNQNYFQKFKEIAQKRGITIGTVRSHGSSDARFFGEKKIPILVISCKGGDIHSDKEWIDLEDLSRFYEVMKEWVLETCRK